MSNLFQNLTSGLAELKIAFKGPVVSQLNDSCPILRGCEKIKDSYSALKVQKSLKVRRNQGVGAGSDGGNMPQIGRQTTVSAVIDPRYNWLRFGITAAMISASKNDAGSFVRGYAFELSEGMKDFTKDISRQLSWDGTGYLAKVSANAVSSTVITAQGREGTQEDGNKFLDAGMVIDVVTSGGTLVAQSAEIIGVTGTSTATITLSIPVTVSSTDLIIRSGSQSKEIQGLLYALDGGTSTIYTVDRSAYPAYQGNVINRGGAQFTLDALQQAWNEGLRRGGSANGKYSAIYSDFDSQRYYQKLLLADKRFVNSMKGDGGFASATETYLEFNGLPWIADPEAPQRVFILPVDCFEIHVLEEMTVAEETGSSMLAVPGVDAFEVRLRYFANMFNKQPSACAVVRNYISP